MTPLEFRPDFWQQKTRVPGLSYGIVCLILYLVVLIQYRRDARTDEWTDRRMMTAYNVLAQLRAAKRYYPIIDKEYMGVKK